MEYASSKNTIFGTKCPFCFEQVSYYCLQPNEIFSSNIMARTIYISMR